MDLIPQRSPQHNHLISSGVATAATPEHRRGTFYLAILRHPLRELMTHVVNRRLTRHAARHAHPAPHGCVAGRQLFTNAVELGGEMRCPAVRGDIHRLAVAALVDLIAASTSVDHGFVMSAT